MQLLNDSIDCLLMNLFRQFITAIKTDFSFLSILGFHISKSTDLAFTLNVKPLINRGTNAGSLKTIENLSTADLLTELCLIVRRDAFFFATINFLELLLTAPTASAVFLICYHSSTRLKYYLHPPSTHESRSCQTQSTFKRYFF